jgi:hypothetical protein
MVSDSIPWLAALIGLGVGAAAIAALLWLLVRTQRRNHAVKDAPELWSGLDYCCPKCGAHMERGWVLLGKGAIWSDHAQGRPGAFSLITQALPNTLSFRVQPASNMAWRCSACRLLLVDYAKLVY